MFTGGILNLRALLNQRRYRRLLLHSAPSNQDRVLTLTLENTTYEGLKETSVKEEDTINATKVAKAAALSQTEKTQSEELEPSTTVAEEAPVEEKKPQESPQQEAVANELKSVEPSLQEKPQETQPTEVQEQAFEVASKPVVEPSPASDENINSEQAESSSNTQSAELQSALLPTSSNALNSSPEYIAANELSPIKLNVQPKEAETDTNQQTSNVAELDVAELEMLDKKIKRWSSSMSKKLASSEPIEWRDGGQQYVASFSKQAAENDMETDEVMVEIATERDGKKLTTNLRLKKMAFSNFAQFVHQWDDRVSIHEDEMNGRFHSNTKISVVANRKAAPMFHGKVTTGAYFVDIDGNVSRKDIFLAGLETGVKRIAMPKPKVLFNQTYADESVNSQLIEQDSRLIFKHDGSYLVQTLKETGVMQPYPIGEQPLYILAAPGVSLYVSGIVNGAVAVYSPKRIIIEGNLEYAQTDHIDEGGDFLGLISGNSVVIANRKMVPEGDLNIQAAIYAKDRFQVKQLGGKRMGTLNILGSVSAGSITATEPRYATNIVFDTRLENLRPPGFPVTDRYELLAQQNHWELEDDPFFEALEQDELTNELLNKDSTDIK